MTSKQPKDANRFVHRLPFLQEAFFAGLLVLPFISLRSHAQPLRPEPVSEARMLAKKYCAACHIFPEPHLMDKATWKNGTMPFLKKRIGISQLDPENPEHRAVLKEWSTIWDYYFEQAPEKSSPANNSSNIEIGLPGFKAQNPAYRPGRAFVTLVQIDPERKQLYVGNAQTHTLDVLSSNGKPVSSVRVDSPPVSLNEQNDGWYATLIGRVPPHNQRLGKLVRLARDGNQFRHERDILTELPRPTDCQFGDLNGDGLTDLVISGFGNILGELTWHENLGQDQYRKHTIYNRPGAVATTLRDFDRDGRVDIAALMAQAQEGVFILLNEGRSRFTEYPAIRNHPAWGYAGFQMLDFDEDGKLDILTANGDNGEYPSCLKPYHGVRLYRNTNRGFEEVFFLPLNGAFKAIAEDFDGDGDRDIAAISYFPNYNGTPEESFVLFWNLGSGEFKPETFPESYRGRWLTMDSGDLDGDGDVDLVLGAANRTPYAVDQSIEARWKQNGPSILILRNQAAQREQQAHPNRDGSKDADSSVSNSAGK